MTDRIIIAVPKGRILAEALPLLAAAGVVPEPAFSDENSRALRFSTNVAHIDLIRVRAFDVATFVAHGAAQLGIVGSDVLMEFAYSELYAPVDLGIGHCRLSVAEPADLAAQDDPRGWSHVRIATKYPGVTRRHFAARGVQAECVKLNGAMELAPILGLAPRIVDLVSSGRTLKENGLVEVEVIAEVSSRLVVNRAAFKTKPAVVPLVDAFRRATAAPLPLAGGAGGGASPAANDHAVGMRIAPPLTPPASGRGM
ncbi:ATP phosphoribosyltransferase [Sphingomonas qomolangmaensis]|uniref:ATP phosphoribosyltransferase n=1 Tax=Sphingomonas qomolangmaensis TaxID=2918765 RepID=A0ABY5L443_9SPHN|nr:ATP phosphoribosyltransferase [Sphingomonas qomolangmaensis]UUL81729.1 ATP phosphoribosyltransferase [Sphingomonas qomolangmaensis]